MKRKLFWKKESFFVCAVVLLSLVFIVPRANAQVPYYYNAFYSYNAFYNPFLGFGSLGYLPVLPPNLSLLGFRYASAPTTTSIFPAPTLPAVPAATIGGVGLTSLIPSVAVTQPVPLSQLITTPLSPLITFTPLSLVGLTFAPIPTTAPPAPAPIVLPIIPSTTTSTVTVNPATTAAIISLLSSLLL